MSLKQQLTLRSLWYKKHHEKALEQRQCLSNKIQVERADKFVLSSSELKWCMDFFFSELMKDFVSRTRAAAALQTAKAKFTRINLPARGGETTERNTLAESSNGPFLKKKSLLIRVSCAGMLLWLFGGTMLTPSCGPLSHPWSSTLSHPRRHRGRPVF